MAVLDTSFLIALEKELDTAHARYEDLVVRGEAMRVPAAVWTEYLTGFPPAQRDAARSKLEAGTILEPFGRFLADEAARLQHELLRTGDQIGWHDLQVATTALHYDEPVITSEARFEAVPGLAVLAP